MKRRKTLRYFLPIFCICLLLGSVTLSNRVSDAKSAPGKVKIQRVDKTKKYVIVHWEGLGCDGYQIQLSHLKSFKYKYDLTTDVSPTDLDSYNHQININGKSKHLYTRVRGFNKNENGKRKFGAWSKVKKIKWSGSGSSGDSDNSGSGSSKKAPMLSKTSISMLDADNRTVAIKNVKASQVSSLSLKTSNSNVCKTRKESKVKFQVYSPVEADGTATVTVKLKLKKAIKGKKTYTWKIKVKVKFDGGVG